MAFGAFLTSREIFENDLWTDVTKFRIFFYIVGKAVFAEDGVKKGNIYVKRGQYLRSLRNLREDLVYYENNSEKMYSISTLNRKISELVDEERIIVENTKLGTLFTVVNYAKYQDFEHYKGGTWNNKRTVLEHLQNSRRTVTKQQQNTFRTVEEHQENGDRTSTEQQQNNNNKVIKGNKDIKDDHGNKENNDNHDNYENNDNTRERPTDKDLKDSFHASSISNSVNKDTVEKGKEKTVVGQSLSRNEKIVSIEKAIQFTFDNVDNQVYKEIPGWLVYSDYDSIMTALQETAQLEEIPNKLSSHILNMLNERKKQGSTAMSR